MHFAARCMHQLCWCWRNSIQTTLGLSWFFTVEFFDFLSLREALHFAACIVLKYERMDVVSHRLAGL